MTKQKCKDCSKKLNKSNGYKRKTRVGFLSRCKKCHSTYSIERWRDRKAKAVEMKGGKCTLCGYDRYFGALEFHHTDPSEKDAVWRKLRLKSWESIVKELEKCVLLCSNCHREEHGRWREVVEKAA